MGFSTENLNLKLNQEKCKEFLLHDSKIPEKGS